MCCFLAPMHSFLCKRASGTRPARGLRRLMSFILRRRGTHEHGRTAFAASRPRQDHSEGLIRRAPAGVGPLRREDHRVRLPRLHDPDQEPLREEHLHRLGRRRGRSEAAGDGSGARHRRRSARSRRRSPAWTSSRWTAASARIRSPRSDAVSSSPPTTLASPSCGTTCSSPPIPPTSRTSSPSTCPTGRSGSSSATSRRGTPTSSGPTTRERRRSRCCGRRCTGSSAAAASACTPAPRSFASRDPTARSATWDSSSSGSRGRARPL